MPLSESTIRFIEYFTENFKLTKSIDSMTITEYRDRVANIYSLLKSPPVPILKDKIKILSHDSSRIEMTIFYTTNCSDNAIVYFPGGGFIANLNAHDSFCSHLASKSNCKVILVHYRLAPEFQYPCGLYDALYALKWLYKNTQRLCIDPYSLSIGGDSAGGNIAALIAILAKNENIPLLHQFLISPVTDLSRALDSHRSFEAYDTLLTSNLLKWTYSKYLPASIAGNDPNVSPYWNNNLSNLPPCTIIVGEYDGLRSDSEGYAEKLRKFGNLVELVVCQGQIHAFTLARKYLTDGVNPIDIISDRLIYLSSRKDPHNKPTAKL